MKEPTGRPRVRWVDNIKMDLWKYVCEKGLGGETGGKETTGET